MTERERLTTERRKIFARESLTIMSMTKEELRQHYNEIFDRLQEYEVAEENNQIIVPPCKVGDVVYRKDDKKVYDWWQIEHIEIYFDEIVFVDDSGNRFTPEDIGETVFLTRKEAEKALEVSK